MSQSISKGSSERPVPLLAFQMFRPTEFEVDGFQRSEGDCMNPNFTHTSTTLSRQPTKMSAGRLPSVYPPTLFLLVHPSRSCGHHTWHVETPFSHADSTLENIIFLWV